MHLNWSFVSSLLRPFLLVSAPTTLSYLRSFSPFAFVSHFSGRCYPLFGCNPIPSKNRYRFVPSSWVPFLFDMGKTKGGYYAVARGRTVGIFQTWDDCKAQVDGFANARYKKFATQAEADAFISEHRTINTSTVSVPAKSTVSSSRSASSAMTSSGGSRTFKSASSAPSSFSKANTSRRAILLPNVVAPAAFSSGPPQKRDLSSLKVTEDRIINKRPKLEASNSGVDLESFTVDEDGYVVVYTDGACTKNGRLAAKAGIGVYFGENHPLNISEPVDGRQTNNTAEIQAAEQAIRAAKLNGINKLNVKTDSQFTINCVTKWLYNWKRKGWKLSSGGDVKNKEDLIKLDSAMQNMEIKWSYVAGHKGIAGNEAADRLAVSGAERSKR